MAGVFGAFGLAVRSELALPELPALAAETAADVEVGFGDAGPADPGLRWIGGVFQAKGDDCLYRVDDVGRFRIRRGRQILIEPGAAADAASLRLHLLGGAFAALMHQRGLLPLHASTVRIGERVVALAGVGGAGKSSLAAALLGAGHRLLGDDICAVASGADGRPITWNGIPRLKLRADAAARTQDPALERTPDIAGKRHLIAPADDRRGATALNAVYVLQRTPGPCDLRLQPLAGDAALRAILSNIYRPSLGRAVDGGRAQFQIAGQLAAGARVSRLRFWPDAERLGELVAAVEADAVG